MSTETEKLTINIGVVELAQIDVLVEQGIYSNRSDCIRTAVREHLKGHSDRMELQLTPIPSKDNWTKTVGILALSKKTLEKLAEDNEKLNVSVIGMLVIDSGVSAELFEATVDRVVLRGKLIAPNAIKEIVEKMK